MRLVMLGPPGSGKGTQGVLVAEAAGVPHVSSGAALRRHGGPEVQALMAAGELVDDQVMADIVSTRLAEADAEGGFLLDGYPRDVPQAAALDAWLDGRGERLDAVVLLDAPHQELTDRLLARAQVEDRVDDNPTTITHRLEVYRTRTAPLAAHYDKAGVLRRVDGTGSVAQVAARVAAALGFQTA